MVNPEPGAVSFCEEQFKTQGSFSGTAHVHILLLALLALATSASLAAQKGIPSQTFISSRLLACGEKVFFFRATLLRDCVILQFGH